MKGYRTIIVNLILALAPLLALWGLSAETLIEHVDKVIVGGGALYGLINIFLRFITSTPVGKNEAAVNKLEEDILWSGKSQS